MLYLTQAGDYATHYENKERGCNYRMNNVIYRNVVLDILKNRRLESIKITNIIR